MKRLAFWTPTLILVACLSGCEDSADGGGDDAGSSGDDDSAEQDDDTADDDTADDDTADDDTADDDTADDDTADDDTADDDTADDDVAGDGGADDDLADDDAAGDGGADDDLADDDAAGDGGADDDLADDDVAGDGGAGGDTIVKSGVIGLTQGVIVAGPVEVVTANATAAFSIQQFDSMDPPAPGGETETVGDCTLTLVDPSADSGSSTGTSTAVSAGEVTVDGATEPVALSPQDDATYTPFSGMALLWEGGETLTASAPGSDDVPEFELELTAPTPVVVSEPVLDPAVPTELSLSAALDFVWDDGNEGTVTVTLAAGSEDEPQIIMCQVPSGEGGVTVSEELLAQLAAGDGVLTVTVDNVTSTMVEDWTMVLSAGQLAAFATVTFVE